MATIDPCEVKSSRTRRPHLLRSACSAALALCLAAAAGSSAGAPADQAPAPQTATSNPAPQPLPATTPFDAYLPALKAAEGRSDWAEVERLAMAAIRELKSKFDERDASVAEALEWLATALAEQDRGPEAETTLRDALRIRQAVQGENNPDTAAAYMNLAATVSDDGRYTEAEPLYRAALQIRRTVLGEQHPDTAQSYSSLATTLHLLGRYGDADPLFRRALEIWRGAYGDQNADTATGYNDLAANLTRQGRFGEAEPLFRQALEISLATLGEQHPDTAASYLNLAACIEGQGRYADAEPLIRKALGIWRTALGEQHPYSGYGYQNLAGNLESQGRYAEAEPLFRKALDIQRAARGEQHPTTAAAYNDLASNLNAQRRYAEAEPLHRKALEIRRARLGEQHHDTAGSYNNLATSLSGQGRYAEAEPLLRTALDLWRATLGEQHPNTASGYGNLASNFDRQGRYADAEPLHRKALEIRLAALGEQHPVTALGYNNLADNLERQGRHAEAAPLYRRALDIRRSALGEQHPDTAWAFSDLASNLNSLGRYQEAVDNAARALSIARHNRTATARSNSGGADAQNAIYRLYPAIAWDAAAEKPERTAELRASAYTALQDSLHGSAARALAQAAARSRAAAERSSAPGCGALDLPAVIREQQDLQARARFEDARLLKALGAADQSDAPKAREALATIMARLAVLETEIGRCFPRYAELVSAGALDVAGTQARLQRDEAVLLIAPAGDDVFVFAVSKTAAAWHRLVGGSAPLSQRVGQLRCQLDAATCAGAGSRGAALAGFDRTTSYALYRDLIQPVEAVLGRTKRLYVVTSGPIGSLPLGVLNTRAPLAGEDDADPEVLASSEWLSDRYAMITLPSVSSLRVFGRSQPARSGEPLMGFGDPILAEQDTRSGTGATPAPPAARGSAHVFRSVDTDGVSLADPETLRQAFSPLPGARIELQNIALALGAPQSSLRLGVDATEASVKTSQDLISAQVVVFATHGLLPREITGMDEPGLVFTPPVTASARDDGVLTASEATGLSLSARWVILSACNTASPDGSSTGESLSGLAKAFLYAGAQALLASHWRVRDDASSLLTVETLTVQRANPRMTRAQALQLAMRTIRTGKRADGSPLPGWTPSMAHPSAWAPFVIVSDQDR
ncbi:MAG: CHAT domain-containing protein [Caulobacteraceae bacterium]|nr:CHAT domain-containing protein [Caulobacteraceae bacterium]